MNHYDIRTSPEFKEYWFAIPEHVRQTLSIRSVVIGFNAAKAIYEAKLRDERDDQAGASWRTTVYTRQII